MYYVNYPIKVEMRDLLELNPEAALAVEALAHLPTSTLATALVFAIAEAMTLRQPNDEKEMNIDLARQDHLDAAEELMKEHSNIGAIVMECTNMSPFAADVRKKFEVPVFNIYTFIEWFQSGLLPTRFNPDHDDPRK